MSYQYLMDIALILISTKVLGLMVKRFQMPQVVGALLAGLILGPAVFNILHATDFLTKVAELGVIVIMFSAGVETDINELKRTGKSGFLVALLGVLVPLVLGTGLTYFFNNGELGQVDNRLLQNIFMGVILTATSVSITVETLKEIGKLSTKVGNTILAAALIDDILGLVALTIVTSMAGTDVNVLLVVLKIILFFVFAGVASVVSHKVFNWYIKRVNDQNLHRFPIAAFVFCLVMAFSAEHLFGVADIIGAFVAGLVISKTSKAKYIASKFSPMSYLLLTPIFFASIGIKVIIPQMSFSIILFSILLLIVAVTSKLFGCGLGAKLSGFKMKDCVRIGFGMACRGEVTLIVANKGVAMGVLSAELFGPVIIMVVFLAVFTPIILKLVFKDHSNDDHQSDLVESYEKNKTEVFVEQKILSQAS